MTESLLISPENRPPAKHAKALNVALVDNVPESRALLKAALRSINYIDTIRETGTAGNIPQILSEQPVNIVIIEENLNEEDIFALVKKIRANPSTSKVKFILMSSNLNTESRRKGMEAGILGYLSKPFDIRGLESAIRDAMGKVSTNHKETLNKVRRISFFSDFSDLELVKLLKICHTRKFAEGETIFSEGELGDRFYVLLAGTAEITKQRKDRVESLMTVHAGECFGEMAIVDAEPRSADVRALSDAILIEVNAQIIKNVNDVLALKIYRKLAILVTKKLRSYTEQREDEQ